MKKKKQITFKTMEEFNTYYASQEPKEKQPKNNTYYQIGKNIAKMACEQAIKDISTSHQY